MTRPSQPAEDGAVDRGGLLRPYALTSGRVRSRRVELEIETLVSTTLIGELAERQALERRSIVLLCRQPHSVAELSALLSLPLGVVRVLVGDMVGDGLVEVHGTACGDDGLGRALLERVLDGLCRI